MKFGDLWRRRRKSLGVVLAGLLGLVAVASSIPTNAAVDARGGRASWGRGDWPGWQYDLSGSRYNATERQITPDTVDGLELKWAWAGPGNEGEMHSQPAVVGDTLYVGGQDAKFYALDAKTGEQKWVYDTRPVAGPTPPRDPVADPTDDRMNDLRDGPLVVGDTVFFGDARTNVYALDRHTGRLRWSTLIHDHPHMSITSSPIYFDRRIFIGTSGGESGLTSDPDLECCSGRGKVVALDARTGRIEWSYYTVPPATYQGTWPGTDTPRYGPSGGGVWSSPAIDPRTRTLFFGTGNNYSGSAGDIDALVALDLDTGQRRWRQRFTFPDTWNIACILDPPGPQCDPDLPHPDSDVGPSPNIFHVDGRTLVGVGQKGHAGAGKHYHVLDARTGEIVWERRLSDGVQWGSAYDGKRIYVGTQAEDGDRLGVLYALDPATGKSIWETPLPENGCSTGGAAEFPDLCEPVIASAASATPGLVYAGAYDGKMRVYSAKDGEILWEYDTIREFQAVNGGTVRGGAISGGGGAVIADGMLYVNSGYSFQGGIPGHVLLAFGLE